MWILLAYLIGVGITGTWLYPMVMGDTGSLKHQVWATILWPLFCPYWGVRLLIYTARWIWEWL